jgi:hypothetical protein
MNGTFLLEEKGGIANLMPFFRTTGHWYPAFPRSRLIVIGFELLPWIST